MQFMRIGADIFFVFTKELFLCIVQHFKKMRTCVWGVWGGETTSQSKFKREIYGGSGWGRDATPEFPPHKHIYPFLSLSLGRRRMTTTIFSLSFFIFLLPALSVCPPAAAEAGKGNWLNALSVLKCVFAYFQYGEQTKT